MISCGLAYYPIGKVEYEEEINKVIQIIKDAGIAYEVNEMSTVIKGESELVFSVLKKITNEMTETKFVLNLSISNTCGCEKV